SSRASATSTSDPQNQSRILTRTPRTSASAGDVCTGVEVTDRAQGRDPLATIRAWPELLAHTAHVDVDAAVERQEAASQGAELQPHDPVDFVPARGEHQHRNTRRRADRAQYVEAVDARQHHVEHDELVIAGAHAIDGPRAVAFGVEGKSLAREILAHQIRQL